MGVEVHRRACRHGDDVELLLAVAAQAVGDRGDVVRARDDLLAEAEPHRELKVVAGRAHRDGEGRRRLTGAWIRISIGSSVTNRSGRSSVAAPSTASTRTGVTGLRTESARVAHVLVTS